MGIQCSICHREIVERNNEERITNHRNAICKESYDNLREINRNQETTINRLRDENTRINETNRNLETRINRLREGTEYMK